MKYVHPLAWFVVLLAFCLCSWYVVENHRDHNLRGEVSELRTEAVLLEKQVVSLGEVLTATHIKATEDDPVFAAFIEVSYQNELGEPFIVEKADAEEAPAESEVKND